MLENDPGLIITPIYDQEKQRSFDYPEPANRVKYQVACALAGGVDYINSSRIEGDIAEFGVGSGWTGSVIARSLAGKTNRVFHLFDSFSGLPKATSEVDLSTPMVIQGVWGTGTCNWGISEQDTRRLLAQFCSADILKIYSGWFIDTLPALPSQTKFALVHIDCDLYQSTFEVLDALFGKRRLSPGCILLFDDWTCNQCSPQVGQQRAWSDIITKFHIAFLDFGFYGHAGKRFIVISY